MKRASGILLPIYALPSPYGIGTMGKAAYEFVDFLEKAGQKYWQILPLGPTGYGDSPYQCTSDFAGNPYLIDIDMLIADGLLTQEEADAVSWGESAGRVDYGLIYQNRMKLLKKAAGRGLEKLNTDENTEKLRAKEFRKFLAENLKLEEYALFAMLKEHFSMVSWQDWPDEGAKWRDGATLERYRNEFAEDIEKILFIQFIFEKQWQKLREYARSKGIGLIGDVPIYVPLDSCEVWKDPKLFLLDENKKPTVVAGCPPDAFSPLGQLWGNPIYDWNEMRNRNYGWWIDRIGAAARRYDIIRLDHFRGFESYWSIPANDENAQNGRWVKGPGMDLVGRLTSWFADTKFLAEDLGFLTDDVRKLLKDSGMPGMKVLSFAFSPDGESAYLPFRYDKESVCYTGTHDNEPIMGRFLAMTDEERAFAAKYMGTSMDAAELSVAALRLGLSSVSELFVAQMQDWLGKGSEARTNTPGIPQGNWQWRLQPGELTDNLAAQIRSMTELYGR